MGQLAGKRCLIVGGTSGIGLAAARRFVQEGAKVVVVGREESEANDMAFKLAGLSDWFLLGAADAADAATVKCFFADAVNHLGGLDVLYHVAGGSGRKHGDGPLHECTDAGWQVTLDTNLRSTFLTNRAAVQQFLGQKQPGAILNMASVLAFSPSPRHFDAVAYTAAKGGIVSVSRLAAARYAADGIRVNVIAPGLIDTPMSARACGDPAILAYLRSKQPLRGGPGQPEDCSDVAVFLCSDAARFITGAVVPVDGGWSLSEGQYV